MGIIELLGLAGSLSLLSGWRLYLTVFATGLAMKYGGIDLPENLAMLDTLANPWVIGIAGAGAVAEFFADKIAWLDSAWDTLHTIIRPVGGALLALAVVDASDPAWQVIAFLLGGGAALLSHGAKASTRAAVNVSPEPFSNIVVSGAEDVATGGLLLLAISNPEAAVVIAIGMLVAAIIVIYYIRKLLKRIFANDPAPEPETI